MMKTDGLSAKFLISYMNIFLAMAEYKKEILYSYYNWQLTEFTEILRKKAFL